MGGRRRGYKILMAISWGTDMREPNAIFPGPWDIIRWVTCLGVGSDVKDWRYLMETVAWGQVEE